jgi:hypothetical protein
MDDLKTVWKTQSLEDGMITLTDARARADKFQAHVRLRNVIFYVYALFNIVVSLWLISTGGRWEAFLYPMLLMIAAHLWVLWQVTRRIGARPLPAEMGGRPALDFYRDELKRQASGRSRAWLWYIAPFIPPYIWELAIWQQRIEARAVAASMPANYLLLLFSIFGAVFFWTAVWLAFSRASLKLELQIERLNAVKAE